MIDQEKIVQKGLLKNTVALFVLENQQHNFSLRKFLPIITHQIIIATSFSHTILSP